MSGLLCLCQRRNAGRGTKSALVALLAFASFVLLLPASAQDVTLNQPERIICRNDANADVNDSVQVRWKDKSENESGYEVHRKVDDGDFSKVDELGEDSERFTDSDVEAGTEYRYKVRAVDNGDTGSFSDSCRRPQQLDSQNGNFRVYHRPYPASDAPPKNGNQMTVPSDTNSDGDNEYAARVGGLLEGTSTALEALGFKDFTYYEGDNDSPVATDLKWCDGGGCAWTNSYANGKQHIGLAPQHMEAYDPSTGEDARSVAISLHEGFHLQQYSYGGVNDDPARNWVLEGQARSIQDKVCVDPPGESCKSLDAGQNGFADYVGQSNNFLSNPNRDLTRSSYNAALFWTYLLEQYGDVSDEPERGMDVMREFWERAQAQRNDTGIGTINRALSELGESDRFADVFKNFVVANYAKDLDASSVPDTHQYVDETQPPGSYNSVGLDVDTSLGVGEQVGPNLTDVSSWGARYYQVRPDSGVGTMKVEAHQDVASNPAFYAVLAIDNGKLMLERRGSGSDFEESFDNAGYDRVVLIVAGLRQDLNFRWAINAEEPVMDIVEPVFGQRAQAGDPGDPDKFLTKVDVLNPDGDPVAGIAPESFTVTVGSEAVSDDEMVSRSFVQGQYWLLLQAPEQSGGPGRYDLTVEVAGLSDTEVQAVEYGERSEVDNELIVDYSGSMGNHDKMASTRQAAHLYVDTWPSSDLAGLVRFSDTAQVEEDLNPLTDAHRESLHSSIDNLTEPDGQTAIGEGLFKGLDQLDNRGDENHDWAMVLLSDGKQTSGNRNIDDFVDEYETRKSDGDPTPEVHTVALGPDADRGALQSLANETGGTYQFASLPDSTTSGTATTAAAGESDNLLLRLPAIWRVISEEVVGEQQVFAGHGNTDTSPSNTFQVDGGAEELTVAVSSEGSQVYDATLTDPSGTEHDPAISQFDRTFWRVGSDSLEAGEWTIRVDMAEVELPLPQDYQVDAAVTSHLTMEGYLGLAPEDRLAGRGMPILVSLSDTGPITGANVNVEVTAPDGSASTLMLHDDGAHGDGEAGDGFYGATYRGTHDPGSYVATISAEGSSGVFGDFARRARTSFATAAGDDSDGDGLPDWWEEEHGTDPTTRDATDDPDSDVLTTREEWEIGTLPLDPDTDGGGELDGTDPDPLDPSDDRLTAPDAEAYPGVGEVTVRYSNSDQYTSVRVERASNPEGPFTAIADGVSATGEHTDTEVTNGDEFCYRVRGLGGGAESAYSSVTCATPRTDPIPPDGTVLIEEAPRTADPEVTLDLAAIDNPEPHTDHPGSPPRPQDAEESGVAEMRLANQGDLAGVDWESFAETREWTLPDKTGPATVYVQYRDSAGNTSDVIHATIELVEGEGTARHGGPTRIETAREISRTTHESADTVVLARADEYADALAGAPLATHLDGPVLLTGGGELHPAVADEIERLGAGEAVLLGGQAALSQQVASDVADLGVDVRRLGGSNRFDTARLVADELPDADEVYVAEGIHTDPGRGWPDAMSAAGAAAGQQTPVLLVAHGLVPDATTQALGADQDVAIVGGTAAVSSEVADTLDDAAGAVRRLSGSTRYDTSAAVADDAVAAGADPATTWVATGRDWADALVSAAATGHANGVLVMVDGQNLEFSPASRDWIADHADQIATLNLAGGTAAISSDTADALTALIEP